MKYLIGIFGSTFDPPTLGHKDVIEQAANICHKIILVPSARHAFMKQPLSFEKRVLLLHEFVDEMKDQYNVTLSEIEKNMLDSNTKKPVYTFDLMTTLQARLKKDQPDCKLIFIRGPDNAEEATWRKFYRYKEIEQQWEIFTAKARLNVRSSKVREILASKTSFAEKRIKLSSYLSANILNLIEDQQFYLSVDNL